MCRTSRAGYRGPSRPRHPRMPGGGWMEPRPGKPSAPLTREDRINLKAALAIAAGREVSREAARELIDRLTPGRAER